MLVPWILFSTANRLPAGLVVSQPVRLLDLMPTLVDYAGIQPPEGVRGQSLVPLIDGSAVVDLPDRFVVETRFREADKMGLYTRRWKYIQNRDEHPGLPVEELHVVGRPSDGVRTDVSRRHLDVVEELGTFLARWESEHPRARTTPPRGAQSVEEIEQLRSLGYLQ